MPKWRTLRSSWIFCPGSYPAHPSIQVAATSLCTTGTCWEGPQECPKALPAELLCVAVLKAGWEVSQSPCLWAAQQVLSAGISSRIPRPPTIMKHAGYPNRHKPDVHLHQNCSRINLSFMLIPQL